MQVSGIGWPEVAEKMRVSHQELNGEISGLPLYNDGQKSLNELCYKVSLDDRASKWTDWRGISGAPAIPVKAPSIVIGVHRTAENRPEANVTRIVPARLILESEKFKEIFEEIYGGQDIRDHLKNEIEERLEKIKNNDAVMAEVKKSLNAYPAVKRQELISRHDDRT